MIFLYLCADLSQNHSIMDIDLLSKMVKELILDDDKVVLPGLGCFVAEIVPAYFSDKGYTINPPYRKLYFRARPDEGDALIDFYAKSNDVAYEVAEKIIKDFVAELKSVLHVKKVVVFPGLGRLRATKENNVFFIADEDLDIYPEGFGLEPVSLKTHKETAAEVSAAVVGLKTLLESEPVVEPEPTPEPESTPEQEQLPEPTPEPEDVPAPTPTPEPTPEESSEPTPEQEDEFLVEPTDEPEPADETEQPEPAQPTAPAEPEQPATPAEPTPAPTQPAAPTQPVGQAQPTQQPSPAKPKGKSLGKVLLVILAIFVVLVIAYMAVGRLCPEWIDQFLYTPEELEILNR